MDREDYVATQDRLNARLERQIERCSFPLSEAIEARREFKVLTFREQIVFVEAMEAQEA